MAVLEVERGRGRPQVRHLVLDLHVTCDDRVRLVHAEDDPLKQVEDRVQERREVLEQAVVDNWVLRLMLLRSEADSTGAGTTSCPRSSPVSQPGMMFQ